LKIALLYLLSQNYDLIKRFPLKQVVNCFTKLTNTAMSVGRGALTPPWILKFSAKKGCFLSFEREKSNFTTFGPTWKNSGKIP